jgi:hypothetical protein
MLWSLQLSLLHEWDYRWHSVLIGYVESQRRLNSKVVYHVDPFLALAYGNNILPDGIDAASSIYASNISVSTILQRARTVANLSMQLCQLKPSSSS